MTIHIYKEDPPQAQAIYRSASTSTLTSNENVYLVKLDIRSSRRGLIFVVEQPRVVQSGHEKEHRISQQIIPTPTDLPTNYILAKTNVQRYGEAAFRLTKLLNNSLHQEVHHDAKIGEDILQRLKGCQRLDEDSADFRKFLFVTRDMVLKCIDATNLDANTKAIYTTILFSFYDKANAFYSDDRDNTINGVASTSTKLLVNSERILLRFDEYGFHLAEYQKLYLSNILKVISSLFHVIDEYKTNLANAQLAWVKLFSSYESLEKNCESTISNCLDDLLAAKKTIEVLSISLHNEKTKYFFVRYWKAVIVISILLILFLIAFGYLLRFYIRTVSAIPFPAPPVQVTLVHAQPQAPANPIVPPTIPPISVGFNFTRLHGIIGIETLLLAWILQKKSSPGSIESSTFNKFHQQERDRALHRREMRLIEGSIQSEGGGNNALVENKIRNNPLETISKLGDDVVNITKMWLGGSSIASLIHLINSFFNKKKL
jgi:hypothetical protein